jgi:hypothetical protein
MSGMDTSERVVTPVVMGESQPLTVLGGLGHLIGALAETMDSTGEDTPSRREVAVSSMLQMALDNEREDSSNIEIGVGCQIEGHERPILVFTTPPAKLSERVEVNSLTRGGQDRRIQEAHHDALRFLQTWLQGIWGQPLI